MSQQIFFKALQFKLILAFSVLLIISAAIFGGLWWYQNSAYKTYWRVSDALVNRNYQGFYNQMDIKKVLANLPKNAAPEFVIVPQDESILKNYLEGFLANSKTDKLPKNQWEVFGNSELKKTGEDYTLDLLQASQMSSVSQLRLVFQKVNSDWKITKIDWFFGPANRSLEQVVLEGEQAIRDQPKYEPQKNVTSGETTTIYDLQVKVVSSELVDSLEAYPTDDSGVVTSNSKIKVTPRTNQTKLLKIQYSQQNPTGSSTGATDLAREFKLQTQNGERIDTIKNISDTAGGQKVEGVGKYTEVTTDSIITRIVVFEVPNNFDISTSTLVLPNTQKGGQDILFKLS